MKTILPDDLTPGKYNKIYLSGHGSAGLPLLKCGDEFLSPSDIVDRIVQHNLHEIDVTGSFKPSGLFPPALQK
ncbi:T3SS effector EspS domain protein [Escherichia coli DEC2E]|nr:T3SS effector EspS domain protein [Escherichia coli DEC2E]